MEDILTCNSRESTGTGINNEMNDYFISMSFFITLVFFCYISTCLVCRRSVLVIDI